MFCLHIGIALGNYFGININVPKVDASTWFLFCGSYLGGTMTLAGVMLTLRHERNIHQYEKSMESIDKEKDALKLFELLQMIDAYVVVSVSNALSQALVMNCQKSNQQHQTLGQPPEYSEAEIEIYKSKIIDIEPQRGNLLALMEEISKYNQNEIQRLTVLARKYIAVRQQNAYKNCFSDKSR